MNFYTFLPKLLNMSLTASVAIVCVLLLRLLLKKAPKVISYCLWAVVLFRLLCPVSITSDLSLFGVLNAPAVETVAGTSSMEYVSENIVHTEFPKVQLPIPGISEAINSTLPQGEEQLVADPLEGPVFIGTYVWLLGVLVMAVYSVISYVRLRRKLLIVSPLQENIYLADEITTPFVMGLFRPRIYLPSDTEEGQMSYIILHEKHHIRRGDHIMKVLAFIALSIHWFNPFVWAAFFYANKDMEMSCDEAVVKKMGDHILGDYTASLLSLATGKTIIAGVPLAFGEGDTKGRIRNLAHWKKPTFWVVLVAVIAGVALSIGLLTNPSSKDMPDHSVDGYYLLIGAEGVESIELSGSNASGGVVNADGSVFQVGETVWLEQLQGVTDLRGIMITALGAEGKILYMFSVPQDATAEEIAYKVGKDTWLLVPTDFEVDNAASVENQIGVEGTQEMTEGEVVVENSNASPEIETETAEDYYSMVTSASAKEVEQFAAGIKEDIIAKDWESLSQKLVYPIQIDGKVIGSNDEFLQLDIDARLSREFVDGIVAESCREMFFNYQGIMMGATGQVWIASVDNGSGQWKLKVIALNGLLGQVSLERVMDRIAGQGLELAIPYENGHIGIQEDALIKLCVSENGKYEAYGFISPEYGQRGILLNNIIDGEGNWTYINSDWGYGKKTPEIIETEAYEVQFSYYRENGNWCELIFDTYETGTMSESGTIHLNSGGNAEGTAPAPEEVEC